MRVLKSDMAHSLAPTLALVDDGRNTFSLSANVLLGLRWRSARLRWDGALAACSAVEALQLPQYLAGPSDRRGRVVGRLRVNSLGEGVHRPGPRPALRSLDGLTVSMAVAVAASASGLYGSSCAGACNELWLRRSHGRRAESWRRCWR